MYEWWEAEVCFAVSWLLGLGEVFNEFGACGAVFCCINKAATSHLKWPFLCVLYCPIRNHLPRQIYDFLKKDSLYLQEELENKDWIPSTLTIYCEGENISSNFGSCLIFTNKMSSSLTGMFRPQFEATRRAVPISRLMLAAPLLTSLRGSRMEGWRKEWSCKEIRWRRSAVL